MSRKISGDKLDIEMLMGLNHYDYKKEFEIIKNKDNYNDKDKDNEKEKEKKQELICSNNIFNKIEDEDIYPQIELKIKENEKK
jgi:hypothetical protein